ncbi:MAG: efflux transporter outer rane subunit [Alphaproteobacteria bacterium]|nr:efflux transporter outer rane subunit [Alphaproteobacteria bacterium]
MPGPKLLLPAFVILLAGCATVGPDYTPPLPSALGVPANYVLPANAASPQDLTAWWGRFNDPLLDRFIAEAISGNLDLAVARSRLRQAREASIQARSDLVPTVGVSGGVGRTIDSQGNSSTDLSLGGDAAWEADLFGGISRGIEAARADEQGAGFDLAAIRIAAIGDVATNYVQARLAQQRLQNARDQLAIADDDFEIARWRVQAGLVSSLDAEQARAQRAQTAATIPTFESAFAAAAYRIAVLTGQAPGATTAALEAVQPIPAPLPSVAVGIPADTLRQRPDVRSAERALASATARIGVAQAQLYPALRLSGNIGTSALSVGGLFDSITGGLLAGLSQTLFDGGRLHSQVRSQRAAAEGAQATYRQSVLTALEDVENSLVALRSARARQQQFAIALDAANNSAILARSQYRAGLTDFQILLDAERSLLAARDGLTSARADEALATIQLYRALGGGWDPQAAPDQELSS